MNLFRNLKITHQFFLLFGVLIIGFAAIGLAYRQVLDVEQASASRLQQTNAFGDLVNRVSGEVSAMNAEEKGFLLTNDLQQAENFETRVGQVQQNIDALEETVPEEKALGLVTQVRDGLVTYEGAFDALVDTRVLLGLDEKRGLELTLSCAPGRQPDGYHPWFTYPSRRKDNWRVVFGHWSTLGLHEHRNVICLDSGCLWGGFLTAVRLDCSKPEYYAVSCGK